MSVVRLHCTHCGTDFIDARPELRSDDIVMCPSCHVAAALDAFGDDADRGPSLRDGALDRG